MTESLRSQFLQWFATYHQETTLQEMLIERGVNGLLDEFEFWLKNYKEKQ